MIKLIEKIIGIEKALKEKRERLDTSKKEWRKRIHRERKEQGICTICKRILTKSEKERGLINCYSCRYKRRNYK